MLAFLLRTRVAMAVSALLAVVFLSACGSSQPPLTSDFFTPRTVGVATAVTGDISVETTYAAVVQAKEQVDLASMATGRVRLLSVEVGSQVNKGQIIAELTNVTLESQLQQAQAELREAQARLASAQATLGPKQAKTLAHLEAAIAAKEQLTNPSTANLQAAQSGVSTAQSKLDSAGLKLELIKSPSASDIQAAESAMATAQSNLDSANTRLNQLLNPSASDLQTAQGKVATARSKLANKKTQLEQLLNPSTAALAAAQEAVSDAHSRLSGAQVTVNNAISDALAAGTFAQITLNREQVRVYDVIVAAVDAGTFELVLTRLWDDLLTARLGEQADVAILLNPALSSTLAQDELDDVNQSINNYRLSIAAHLSDIISSSVIPEDVNSPMLAENSAQSALDTAQEELKELQNPGQNIIGVARNDVAVEQAALDSALANLEEIQNAGENTIALAQNEVAKAIAALESAKTDLAELGNPSKTSVALAQAEVESAQASLDAARANLTLLENPNKSDLAAAESLVAAAREGYAVTQPPLSEYTLQVAQAAVDKAQAKIGLASQQVEELKILAPFDGVVTRRLLAPGAMASPQTPVATLASSQVVVVLRVEETSINYLAIGQSVAFSSPALPGRELALVVDRIAPAGDQQSFTFLVMLNPTSGHPELKPGMSGQVAITTRLEDAVLVPKKAIILQVGQPALFVVEDNTARLKLVGVGLSDEINVEIRTGITPGDQVVVSGHNLLSEGDPVAVEGSPTVANQAP